MNWKSRKVMAGATAVLALAVGGGVGYAATGSGGSPESERAAVIEDAAGRLGVEPADLAAALKGAALDRLDEAVASGRITQAQADRMREAIESGRLPHGGRHGNGPAGPVLRGAAEYLGLEVRELLDELRDGGSLADAAEAHGKTADGLVQALLADAREHLDAAVTAGRLTQAEADQLLAGLQDTLPVIVNHDGPIGPGGADGAPAPESGAAPSA